MSLRTSTTMLLVKGLLWVSSLPALAVARPRPLQARQTITLSETSSCNDVANYQSQNGLTRIQADMYDMLGAARVLDDYFFDKSNPTGPAFTDYVSGYAAQYGVGQTFSCLIPDSCPRINCANLQDPTAPGTGPAYANLLSFANFNLYMNDLFTALNLAKEDWNGVQVKLQKTYYPYDAPPILLKELVNGLSTLTGIIGASSGIIGPATAATTGSGAALLAGVFGGINLALSSTDESLANLAELEANTQVWYQTIFDQFVWANNNLTATAQFLGDGVNIGLADIIAGGAWVDYTDHPVMNDDTSKAQVTIDALKQALYYYLIGNMINYAWKEQGVFIVKYEMSEDDYNSKGNDWKPGYGDFRFRTWANGYGYFIQRYTSNQDPLLPAPVAEYPPGWGSTATDLGGCDPSCMMRSAAAGFDEGGYGFNFSTNAGEYSATQSTALGWLTDLPSADGFFNIPICDLTGNDHVHSIDDLNTILDDQGAAYDTASPIGLYCYCKDYTDKNGVKFSDQLPQDTVALWEQNCDQGYWRT